MNTCERARDYFSSGYNCCQSVLTAHAESIGLHPGKCKSIASSFGGGVAGQQRLCGAVSGALMVIGMWYYDDRNRTESGPLVEEKTARFLAAFTEKYQSDVCADLLGMSLQEADASGLFTTKCTEIVETACTILQELSPEGDFYG